MHSRDHAQLVPKLNLPDQLHAEIVDHIRTQRVIPSLMQINSSTGRTVWERILFQYYFGNKGKFQVYRLEDDLEMRIRNNYKKFLDQFAVPPKIRLKSSKYVRAFPPHSDAGYPGGDTASLTVPIVTNGETTSWYDAGPEFKMSWSSLRRLRKITSLTLGPNHACLFNNKAVHDVTNCKPGAERYVLVIGWRDVEFDQLINTYSNLEKNNYDFVD